MTRREPSKIPNFVLDILNPARLFYHNTRHGIYIICINLFPNGYWLPTFRSSFLAPFETRLCSGETQDIHLATRRATMLQMEKLYSSYMDGIYTQGYRCFIGNASVHFPPFAIVFTYLRKQIAAGILRFKEKRTTVLWRNIDSLKETIN